MPKIGNQLFNNLSMFALVFLMAYVLGLSIINLINERLQNIAIQMPKVEVKIDPKTPLGANVDELNGSPIRQDGAGNPHLKPSPSVDILTSKQGCTQGSTDVSIKEQLASHPKVQVASCQPGKCSDDWQCNQVYGRGANKCVDGNCQCRYGTGMYCHLEPTYYLDPRLMSPAQIVKFKRQAKVSKMTIQDYKNWLSLFEYDLDELPLVHRKNYWRLKKGDTIKFVPLCGADGDTSDTSDTGIDRQVGGACNTDNDVQMYQTWGARQPAQANISPGSQDLVEIKLKIPAVEADTANNYMFTDQHMDTTGYIRNVNELASPLAWSNYSNAFEPNKKYQEYQDNKMRRFKTTPVAAWFQNSAIELSDLVESDRFNPPETCN